MREVHPLFGLNQLATAQEATSCMIVSGSDTPAVFESFEKSLDPVSGSVEYSDSVELYDSFFLCQDFGRAALTTNLLTDGISVVALISEHSARINVVLGHKGSESGAVMGFAWRQQKRFRKTLSVGPGVDFGGETTARTAESLIPCPAPAAQWCARMTVLSIIDLSSLPPLRVTADLPHEDQLRTTLYRVEGIPCYAVYPRGLE